MCDHKHYEDLTEEVEKLKSGFATLEKRMDAMEMGITDLRQETRTGFGLINSSMKELKDGMFAEKKEWGKAARGWVTFVLKAGTIVVLFACGVQQVHKFFPNI